MKFYRKTKETIFQQRVLKICKHRRRKREERKFKSVIELRNIYAQNLQPYDQENIHEPSFVGEYSERITKNNIIKDIERMPIAFGDGERIIPKKFISQTNKEK